MAERVRPWLWLVLLIVAVWLVQLRFGLCTQDDAYISFRYARHLVQGNGLVFNPGERVEGYTNFLWTVSFAPVIAAGLDPAPISMLWGMALTGLLLWITWLAAGRDLLPPLLLAGFAGLSLEAVQGLETLFYVVLVTSALVYAGRGRRGWVVFAGLAALTRPEGYAVFGLLWLLDRPWRAPRRAVIQGALFGVFTVPHLLFRVLYYGDIVPNTFHAKVGGVPWVRGLQYVGGVAWDALPLVVGLIVSIVIALRARSSLGGVMRGAAVMLAFYLVYVVAVGGDFKGTGRFLLPVMPAAALLAARGPRWWRWALGVGAILWSIPGYREMDHFAQRFATELVRRRTAGEYLGAITPKDRWIAVHAAGVLPYYADLPTIDMWGLNDAHIARADVTGLGTGTAGHERHDYRYVLSREPTLILPEQGLLSPGPVNLGDPGVFGPGFLERYQSVSLDLGELAPDPESRVLNLWQRI